MFLCAVARPRWDTARNCWFDGKLGIWPFVDWIPAQRNSRNRPAGTLEPHSVSVKHDVYRKYVCEKVLPAIRRKFPNRNNTLIRIQHDNAPAHAKVEWDIDPMFQAARARNGLNIEFKAQIGKSPDTNVLDLGYFRAIEALQQKRRCQSLTELIQVVNESFTALKRETLEKVFLSHQAVCGEIIKADGTNEFKMPHVKKETLRVNGLLPLSIPLQQDVIAKAQAVRPLLTLAANPMEDAAAALDETEEPMGV